MKTAGVYELLGQPSYIIIYVTYTCMYLSVTGRPIIGRWSLDRRPIVGRWSTDAKQKEFPMSNQLCIFFYVNARRRPIWESKTW